MWRQSVPPRFRIPLDCSATPIPHPHNSNVQFSRCSPCPTLLVRSWRKGGAVLLCRTRRSTRRHPDRSRAVELTPKRRHPDRSRAAAEWRDLHLERVAGASLRLTFTQGGCPLIPSRETDSSPNAVIPTGAAQRRSGGTCIFRAKTGDQMLNGGKLTSAVLCI